MSGCAGGLAAAAAVAAGQPVAQVAEEPRHPLPPPAHESRAAYHGWNIDQGRLAGRAPLRVRDGAHAAPHHRP
ncbi:hypothetical protein ND748_01785 [Frankia sp. AiPs1]|uniref:hypothetical protein n=1 Tax=Frankia sp. AiPs1 TaxID=573493 RepID=UPI0020435CEA|nr:hypothetical protein [Frankia sp. AiPs1]MCM3920418.1 hypothetical protein [Frankia sp. AiPs1]